MQLVSHRSKGRLQNVCQSTEHCFIAFNDISSCERIRGGIGWLAIGGNSSFLCMCHDWCGFCRQIYHLSWAAVKTSCRFTGKAAKRIFWNSGGTHSLCWRSRLRNEIASYSSLFDSLFQLYFETIKTATRQRRKRLKS